MRSNPYPNPNPRYGCDKHGQWEVMREIRPGPGNVIDRVFDISLVEVEHFNLTGA